MEILAKLLAFVILTLLPSVNSQSSAEINSFIPQRLACPDELQIRPAQNLSSDEKAWRATRLPRVVDSVKDYLNRVNIPGFNTQEYFSKLNHTNVPVIGLAISGGGSTSGIGGLGIWQAFDERYEPARQAGTGGIAQSLTYLTGLSGGGFLTVSTLASNQFTTVESIRKAVNFSEDYTAGPTGDEGQYVENSVINALAKQESGFSVSIVDVFGQWLGTYLPEEWKTRLFSDLAVLNTSFSNGTGPMPILGLAEVIPGESPHLSNIMYPGRNSTNGFNLTEYEVTPFEFGSWYGGRVQGFMPLEWLGSAMSNGTPSGETCITNFDRFTFFQGSTANAWNLWLIQDFDGIPLFAKRDSSASDPAALVSRQDVGAPDDVAIPASKQDDFQAIFLNTTAGAFEQDFNDTLWAWVPNPFEDYNDAMMNVAELLLVDGSEAGETDPLRPLMIPQRSVDFIIVYEASTDAPYYSWNNGTNLINSAQAAEQGGLPFPKIPSVDTMVLRNYTTRPTFFGCNESVDTPLVVYLSNSPWTSYSNYSYRMSSFTDKQLDVTLENSFNLATYGDGTLAEGKGWPTCLACAAIKKSVERVGMKLPKACSHCWSRFCWDGTEETGMVDVTTAYNLSPILTPTLSYEAWYNNTWTT